MHITYNVRYRLPHPCTSWRACSQATYKAFFSWLGATDRKAEFWFSEWDIEILVTWQQLKFVELCHEPFRECLINENQSKTCASNFYKLFSEFRNISIAS